MRALGIAIAMLVAACVRSGTTTCADGTLCRDGTVCASAGERMLCVTPEQVAACEGLDERAACGADRCYAIDEGLVCLPIGCGNFFTDTEENEQCDDGNNASQDGCSADCTSTERCGNGVVDPLRGERCDDGNVVSHDGCSSRCIDETARWSEPFTYTGALDRPGTAVMFDARRARVVMFGGVQPGAGQSSVFPQTTSEWDRVWFEETSFTAPDGRTEAALAYDDKRGVTVLFGGAFEVGHAADTWQWTGTEWSPIDASGPSARYGAEMTYDAVNDRMVMYGGHDNKKALNDTWALEGNQWSMIAMDGPPPSVLASMTFDPKAGVVVLVSDGQHWTLEGSTWTRIGTVPARTTSAMWIVFDVGLGQLLLLGSDGGPTLKTWAWDGQAWTSLSRTSVDAISVRHVVADRARGGVIAMLSSGMAVWSTDGTLVQTDDLRLDPMIKAGAAAVTDSRRRVTIMFGGNQGDRGTPSRLDKTFAFDGFSWTDIAPATKPSARWEHAMAYDQQRDRIVLFGGDTESGVSADTYAWNGTTWTRLAPASSPSARSGHAMVYNPETDRIVLFGGVGAAGTLNDTWEWDGTTWTERTSATAAPSRVGAALAYDPLGGGLVMFGGANDTADGETHADLWRLTTTGWEPVTTVIMPSPRRFATLTWAPMRRRLLLVGGERFDDSGIQARTIPVGDTWEWDGARWRAVTASPRAVTQHVAFANPDGTSVTTIGGNSGSNTSAHGLFQHRWRDAGAYETCETRLDVDSDGLAACADPDCWSRCSPLCPLATSCTSERCGDGTCSALETKWICPADCGAAPSACGDLVCDASEACVAECP